MVKTVRNWLFDIVVGGVLAYIILLFTDKFIPWGIDQVLEVSSCVVPMWLKEFAIDNKRSIGATVFIWPLMTLLTSLHQKYSHKYKPYEELISHMEKCKADINNPTIFNIFVVYIKEIANNIKSTGHLQIIDSQDENPVDLAFEITTISSKERKECEEGVTIYKSAISRIRRDRILTISSSLLTTETITFYATEFHLYSIITDDTKWEYDEKYRNSLMNSNCKDIRRIIAIKESDKENIQNLSLSRFQEYLEWHDNNGWQAVLYIIKDSNYPLKLDSFGSSINNCNDLTDFVYVENENKEQIVFAQNDEEKCKYFIGAKCSESKENCNVDEYRKWFDALWEKPKNMCQDQYDRYEINKTTIEVLTK